MSRSLRSPATQAAAGRSLAGARSLASEVAITRGGLALATVLSMAIFAVGGPVDAVAPVPSCDPTAVSTTLPTVSPTGTPVVTAVGAPTTIPAPAPATPTAGTIGVPTTVGSVAKTTIAAAGAPTTAIPTVPPTAVAVTAPPTGAAVTTTAVATTLLPGWVPFVATGGDFVAAFPAQPGTETVNAPTADGGTILIVVHSAQAADGRAYLVSEGTLPPGGTFSLEGGRDGVISSAGGTMTCSNLIDLQGRPGIEAHATVTSGGQPGTLIARIYSSGDRFYQLAVVGPGTFGVTDPGVAAFLSAFQFVEGAGL